MQPVKGSNRTPVIGIDDTQVILTHGGAWAEQTLRAIAAGYDQASDIYFETHNPGDSSSMLSVAFDIYKNEALQHELHASAEEAQWIARCRYLRNISTDLAVASLRSMRKAWDDVLEHLDPKAVFSEAVDSYVISTLENACVNRGVPFYGFVTSFINGYCRVTRYGELGTFRPVEQKETEAVYKLLTKTDYQPAFLIETRRQRMSVVKAWAKNWARYLSFSSKLLALANRERNHVAGAYYTCRANLHLWPRFEIGERDWSVRVKKTKQPTIFVPLQFVPEATIDYWCERTDMIKHDDVLLDFIQKHQSKFQFVVKEHPNAQGLRTPKFYNRLKRLDNVVFAPTMTPVHEVLRPVDAVLTWTGTIGLQAAIQGKPVFNFCHAYYMSGRFFKIIDSQQPAESMIKHIKQVSSQPISVREQMDLIAHTLSGCVPGALRFGHSFHTPSKDDLRRYQTIGETLRNLGRINL